MDDSRFDALAKTLGAAHSRRGLTRLLGGLSLGGVLSVLVRDETAATHTGCRHTGAVCTRPGQCCSGRCAGNGTCQKCTSASQCPAPPASEPCKRRFCTSTGRCVIRNKANEAPCPDDGNPCTRDVCNATGQCTHPADAAMQGLSCGGGKVCTNGQCLAPECTPPKVLCGGSCVSVGESCATGHQGVCATGTKQCDTANGAVVCVPDVEPGTQQEICDGLDNDCDGAVDEDFDFNTDVNNCGACGVTCTVAHGTATCSAGNCELVSCDAGWANCDGNQTCETQLGTAENCGSCGDVCQAPNTTAICDESQSCTYTCDAGWGDCNESMSDGCETDLLTDPTHCGACNAPPCADGQACQAGQCV